MTRCTMFGCCLQLRAAEALKDEVRAERERLAAREAVVSAAESHLESQKRDSERQTAEIQHALQVRGLFFCGSTLVLCLLSGPLLNAVLLGMRSFGSR